MSLYAAGMELWVALTLGRFLVPRAVVFEGHRLTTSSPYRLLRHRTTPQSWRSGWALRSGPSTEGCSCSSPSPFSVGGRRPAWKNSSWRRSSGRHTASIRAVGSGSFPGCWRISRASQRAAWSRGTAFSRRDRALLKTPPPPAGARTPRRARRRSACGGPGQRRGRVFVHPAPPPCDFTGPRARPASARRP